MESRRRRLRRNLELCFGRNIRPPAFHTSKVFRDFKKLLAVWSLDPPLAPEQVVASLEGFLDIKHKWHRTGKDQWKGFIISFPSLRATWNARDRLQRLHVGNQFPLRVVELHKWLEIVANFEWRTYGKDSRLTLLSLQNLKTDYSALNVMALCEGFGTVAEVNLSDDDTGPVYSVCVVKFVYAYSAYAAQVILDGEKILDRSIAATILPTEKTEDLTEELFKRDMMLWYK